MKCLQLYIIHDGLSEGKNDAGAKCYYLFVFFQFKCKATPDDYINAESCAGFISVPLWTSLFSPPLFLCLQAQTDLASLAFIPLAFLDTALCWWISFSLDSLMAVHFLLLEMGFHWSFCKGFFFFLFNSFVDYSLVWD